MNGTISNTQCILLESHLRTIERIDDEINVLNKAIGKFTSKYAEIMEALQTISGVKRTGAEVILAEVGPNVEQFADANNWQSGLAFVQGATKMVVFESLHTSLLEISI